jgi:hypothetical protein
MKKHVSFLVCISVMLVLASCVSHPSGDRLGSTFNPAAGEVLRQMSFYYQNLDSFEGTNTIIDESHALRLLYANMRLFSTNTDEKRFAFVRPNRFILTSEHADAERLFCDGFHLWHYRPYYYNSFTVAPAPARFEDVVTNWIGGEILHVMLMTNRLDYITNGFGCGTIALKYAGKETVDSVPCKHLLLEETGSKTAELWIADGKSPYILKYVCRSPTPLALGGGTFVHTEIISAWKANHLMPLKSFAFVPPPGAIEQPLGADQVEMSMTLTNGVQTERVRFVATNEAEAMKTFLDNNAVRFQAAALKSVLDKYPGLTTNDLAFVNIRPPLREKTLIVTFALPKTVETTNVDHSIQTKEQVIVVTLSHDGNVIHVSKGTTFSLHSLKEKTQ